MKDAILYYSAYCLEKLTSFVANYFFYIMAIVVYVIFFR